MEAAKYCPEQTVWHRLTLVSGDKSETVFSTIISNITYMYVHYIMYIVYCMNEPSLEVSL